MLVPRMHPPVRHKPHEVEGSPVRSGVVHGPGHDFILEEFSCFYGVVDPRNVHADDASRPDIEVADLAVTHLARQQSDGLSRRFYQSVGTIAKPLVHVRGMSKRDRVPLDASGKTESI